MEAIGALVLKKILSIEAISEKFYSCEMEAIGAHKQPPYQH